MNEQNQYNADDLFEAVADIMYSYGRDRIIQCTTPDLGNYQSDDTSYKIEHALEVFKALCPEMAQRIETRLSSESYRIMHNGASEQ